MDNPEPVLPGRATARYLQFDGRPAARGPQPGCQAFRDALLKDPLAR